jgi:hypothetical protein
MLESGATRDQVSVTCSGGSRHQGRCPHDLDRGALAPGPIGTGMGSLRVPRRWKGNGTRKKSKSCPGAGWRTQLNRPLPRGRQRCAGRGARKDNLSRREARPVSPVRQVTSRRLGCPEWQLRPLASVGKPALIHRSVQRAGDRTTLGRDKLSGARVEALGHSRLNIWILKRGRPQVRSRLPGQHYAAPLNPRRPGRLPVTEARMDKLSRRRWDSMSASSRPGQRPAAQRLAAALGVPVERLAEGVEDPVEEESEPVPERSRRTRKRKTP